MTAETETVSVPQPLIGRALVLLDRFPRWSYGHNAEYAAPGTAAWIAEAKNILRALTEDEPPA